jgi:hypothetical protein
MSSKLTKAALAALMLAVTGLAVADSDGRGGRHGDGGRHGQHERGWDRGSAPQHGHPEHFGAPYRPYGWDRHAERCHHRHGYRHPRYGWGHPHPKRHWGHGHRHGFYSAPPKRHADYGDDITIIFRGRLD